MTFIIGNVKKWIEKTQLNVYIWEIIGSFDDKHAVIIVASNDFQIFIDVNNRDHIFFQRIE